MPPEHIQTIVAAYFESLQAIDPQAWIENFTEDAWIHDPASKPPNRVHETYQHFFGVVSTLFEKLTLAQNHIFITGNSAAVKWTMQGWAKNGKQAMAEGISIFEIDPCGKIQEISSYWDDAAMMAQLNDSGK